MVDGFNDLVLQNLVEKGVLDIEKVTEIQAKLKKGKSDLYTLVVIESDVDGEMYAQAQAVAFDLPYVNLSDLVIEKEVLEIVPESTARDHEIVAYEQTGKSLKVAMSNPNDRQIVEFIRKKVGIPIEVSVASSIGVRSTLAKYQASLEAELKGLIQEVQASIPKDGDDLSKVAENLPIIRITDSILKHAILNGASDIHIEPTEKKVVVRYRVDGMLRDMLVLPKDVIVGLVARIKVLSRLQIDEHRLPQDGSFKIEKDDYKVAFRVSILPVFDGEKVVMRLLDESGRGLGIEDIGLSEKSLKMFQKSISSPNGMILVTGPTGSGKTTTLYAAMREMNKPEVNISTIEDPIEYRMPRINQTQVRPKIGLTFTNGLRSLVRQDPDIIMIGEIRDEETASLAVNAALTGHLVLSTLHTNSAAGAVPRLVDMKVEPFLIASTTNLLLAQRLVRRLCEKCRVEVKSNQSVLDSLGDVVNLDETLAILQSMSVVKKGDSWKDIEMYTAGSCDKCHDGYKGRVGIYELLEVTSSIQKLITKSVTSKEIQDLARAEQGMVTMLEEGLSKVVQGITSVEEILRVAKE